MKRWAGILVLILMVASYLAACGDKERSLANQEWEGFKAREIAAVEAAGGGGAEKPYDFNSRVVEVKDSSYRFKGTISFKKGNTLHEHAYAFVDGGWMQLGENVAKAGESSSEAVAETEKKSEKTLDEAKEEIEKIEKKLETLKKDIGVDQPAGETVELAGQESEKPDSGPTEQDLDDEWP